MPDKHLSGVQVSDIFVETPFKVFSEALKSGGIVKAICVPSGAKIYSNTALKKGEVYSEAMKSGAKGLPFLKVLDDGRDKSCTVVLAHFASKNKELFVIKMLI